MKIEKRGEFFKVDDAAKVAYGWAIICTDGGKAYVDLQGDHIPEDVMLDAATEFAENSRVAKDMHAGDQVGEFPFIYPVTKSSKDLGIDATRTGLLVGFKPADPAMLDLIKQGKRTGFSIGGVLTESTTDEIGKVAKAASPSATKTMRTFRAFKIHEISLVDVPAQEGATVGYVKRAVLVRKDAPTLFTRVVKNAVMTDESAGHQHVLDLDDPASRWCSMYSTSYQTAADAENGHSHSWTFDEQGNITVGADSDHTHTLPTGAVVPPDVLVAYAALDAARDAENLETAATPVAVLAEQSDGICAPVTDEESSGKTTVVVVAARAPQKKSTRPAQPNQGDPMKIVILSEAQHAHYSKLGASEQEAFVNKSAAERDAEIAKALESDPVIFKGERSGVEVRKSDGPMSLKLAQQGEKSAELIAKQHEALEKREAEIEKAEVASFAKANMGNLPGDDEAQAYIVRSIRKGGGTPELIEKAFAILKGANTTTNVGKRAPGGNGGSEDASPLGLIQKRAEEIAKATGKTVAQATSDFIVSEEGALLYDDYLNTRNASH